MIAGKKFLKGRENKDGRKHERRGGGGMLVLCTVSTKILAQVTEVLVTPSLRPPTREKVSQE